MDRPELKNGEGNIVDADLLIDLLDTYRFGPFGKAFYVSAGEIGTKPETTPFSAPDNVTKVEDEEEDKDGSQGGNKFVHGSTSSASSDPDPINLETTKSETGSNQEETGYDLLEANSTNSPKMENETQQTEENHEIEAKEEEEIAKSESEEDSNLTKFLTIPENYELVCPNCSACFTRRVILKKRTPEKNHTDEPSDIDKIEPPSKVNLPVTQPEEEEKMDTDFENEEEKMEAELEMEMFSCLACLKYFIRLGARFLQLDFIKGRPVKEPGEDNLEVNLDSKNSETILPPEQERFTVEEVLKSTVYGGLTEAITSLGVVSSAAASGSSTLNILALTIANMAGGLIVLAHNLQDLRNDRNSDQERDQYEKLLGKRSNSHIHILVAILSYIFFGLIPPLVYTFSFYQTGIKNYKLISVFMVSLVCVILLGLVKVYVRKPVNIWESRKSYLKSAAYYTLITVSSSGISYFVGNIVGDFIEKIGWFSLDRTGMTTMFDGIEPGFNRFGSF